ncbi:GGDEF domain-containing protein [Methylobacterium oryzihabitans]|nr:GGDEF domain-containing protein [Methylobacterium oryzihabitans]
MTSATFLLAINFSIGTAFAAAFLGLTWRSDIRLGRWCAAGFLSAAATVTVEAFSPVLPWVRLTSAASFGLLMLALTAITAGLLRHYRPGAGLRWLASLYALAVVFNAAVVFDLKRGSWGQALGYQTPFAAMLAVAAGIVLAASPRRAADLALAAILALSAAQFLVKAILAGLAGAGPGVRDYVLSTYAFYSQTAGGILSLCLGLALIGVVVREVMEEARLRLQRDGLSGVLTRAGFLERVGAALARPAAARGRVVVLCDLDRFKSINDRFGHAAGDEVIRAFGASLRAGFGETALCGRLGGEEFGVVLPEGGLAAALARVEAVRALVRVTRYALVPAEAAVTASFGVAAMIEGEPFDRALHRADLALYRAKAEGRDGWRVAPAADPGDAARPRSGRRDPHAALPHGDEVGPIP